MQLRWSYLRNGLTCLAGVVGWAAVGAVFAGAAGVVIGGICGTVLALVSGDPSALPPTLLHIATCGAAGGAILGGFIRLWEDLGHARDDDAPAPAAAVRAVRAAPGASERDALDDGELLIRTVGQAARIGASPGPSDHGHRVNGSAQDGETIVVEAGEVIPADGEVTDGIALVDEAARTGQSGGVVRGVGGASAQVLRGTRVIAGRIHIRVRRGPS